MRLSRDKEDGADERGSMLAAQAGYASGGLLTFIRTLSAQASKPEAKKAMGQLLSTIPRLTSGSACWMPTLERAATTERRSRARFAQSIE